MNLLNFLSLSPVSPVSSTPVATAPVAQKKEEAGVSAVSNTVLKSDQVSSPATPPSPVAATRSVSKEAVSPTPTVAAPVAQQKEASGVSAVSNNILQKSEPASSPVTPPPAVVATPSVKKDPVILRALVENPESLLTHDGRIQDRFSTKYPYINECRCAKFNRHLVNSPAGHFRDELIDTLIEKIKQAHPDKNALLTITSIGSGGGFQDLVLLATLVYKEGYKNVRFNEIDQGYKEGVEAEGSIFGSRETFNEIVALVRDEILPFVPGTKIEINGGDDVQRYVDSVSSGKPDGGEPDAILMMDFDTGEYLINPIISQLGADPRNANIMLAYTKYESGYCISEREAFALNAQMEQTGRKIPDDRWGIVTTEHDKNQVQFKYDEPKEEVLAAAEQPVESDDEQDQWDDVRSEDLPQEDQAMLRDYALRQLRNGGDEDLE